jgi:rare lipoprotein A
VAQASAPETRRKGSGSDVQPSQKQKLSAGRRLGAGRAAWYQHPGRTASGETFNPNRLTAAHRTLPFGTRVRVVNKHNGRSVVVRINDRVAKKANVTIDLSRQSARALGIEGIGSVALYKVN